MQTIGVDERRARLAVRHRLAPAARVDDDVAAIARSVVVLHATDPSSVVLSALARMRSPSTDPIERALYEDRTVLRMLGMRRTLFTVAVEDAPVVQSSSGDAIAATERKRFLRLLEQHAVAPDPARWLRAVERKTLATIHELGEASAAELSRLLPELAIQIPMAEGKSYATTVGVSSRVLFLLAAEGRLVRGRPQGGWTSSQHRWVPLDSWLGGPLTSLPAPEARMMLAQRWLERFGPGTVGDLAWWTGWTLGHTRTAVAALRTEEVDLDGTPGLVLAGDVEPTAPLEPWVALLPGLDPTTMGWKERAWYLGEHRPQVFDGNGNAGPTVWADGRVVGGWAQRPSGEVVIRLLEDIGRDRADLAEAEAARLQEVLGHLRVTPRFQTPLSRELAR